MFLFKVRFWSLFLLGIEFQAAVYFLTALQKYFFVLWLPFFFSSGLIISIIVIYICSRLYYFFSLGLCFSYFTVRFLGMSFFFLPFLSFLISFFYVCSEQVLGPVACFLLLNQKVLSHYSVTGFCPIFFPLLSGLSISCIFFISVSLPLLCVFQIFISGLHLGDFILTCLSHFTYVSLLLIPSTEFIVSVVYVFFFFRASIWFFFWDFQLFAEIVNLSFISRNM